MDQFQVNSLISLNSIQVCNVLISILVYLLLLDLSFQISTGRSAVLFIARLIVGLFVLAKNNR